MLIELNCKANDVISYTIQSVGIELLAFASPLGEWVGAPLDTCSISHHPLLSAFPLADAIPCTQADPRPERQHGGRTPRERRPL